MDSPAVSGRVWSIILGIGKNRTWAPSPRPVFARKMQFPAIGDRSAFQQVLDLAAVVCPQERTVIVTDRKQYPTALSQIGRRQYAKLVTEPVFRDAGLSAFTALAYIHAQDPKATVVLLPCEYFVYPEQRFVNAMQAGLRAVDFLQDQIVLLGAPPDELLRSYRSVALGYEQGWIGDFCLRSLRLTPEVTARVDRLLGTSALITKASVMWDMGHHCLPQIAGRLEEYRQAIGTKEEERLLQELYRTAPRNVFAGLLRFYSRQAAVIDTTGIFRFDWTGLRHMAAVQDRFRGSRRIQRIALQKI